MLRDNVRIAAVEIKDYAYPTMQAERCLKDLHDAVLDKKWDKAQDRSKEAIKWIWEIQEALYEMRKNAS
jgi:predicted kinase